MAGVYEACEFTRIAKESLALLNQPQLFLDGLSMLVYLKRNGVPVRYGWGVVEARGEGELSEVIVAPYSSTWQADMSKAQPVMARTLAGRGLDRRLAAGPQQGGWVGGWVAHASASRAEARPIRLPSPLHHRQQRQRRQRQPTCAPGGADHGAGRGAAGRRGAGADRKGGGGAAVQQANQLRHVSGPKHHVLAAEGVWCSNARWGRRSGEE